MFTDVDAIDHRKVDVQEHDVGQNQASLIDCFAPVSRHGHLVPGSLELILERFGEWSIILDNQYFGFSHEINSTNQLSGGKSVRHRSNGLRRSPHPHGTPVLREGLMNCLRAGPQL